MVSREEIVGRPELRTAAAYVGWLVYGHALWRAGRHVPTAGLPEVRALEEEVFAGIHGAAVRIARDAIDTRK